MILLRIKLVEGLHRSLVRWHLNNNFVLIRLCIPPGNINWRDIQRKNVVNNVDMSSLRALTKWPVQKHRTSQKLFSTFVGEEKEKLQ